MRWEGDGAKETEGGGQAESRARFRRQEDKRGEKRSPSLGHAREEVGTQQRQDAGWERAL